MRRFLSILVLSLLLPAAYTASAQDTSAQTTRRARLEQEIAIIDHHIKAPRKSYNKLLCFLKCMSSAINTTWHIIYPVNSLNLKGNLL